MLDKLLELADAASVACPHGGCEACIKACQQSPCYGAPREMQAIINAGFGDRLSPRITPNNCVALLPSVKGYEGKPYPENAGECTFLDSDGKCELHALGLKPLIGRILDCQNNTKADSFFQTEVGFAIIAKWETKDGFGVAKSWLESPSFKFNEVKMLTP